MVEHAKLNEVETQIRAESVVFRYRPALISAANEYLANNQEKEGFEINEADVTYFGDFLKNVDRQGAVNYSFYSPEGFPGVKIPFTKINVNALYEELSGEEIPKESDAQTETVVQLQAWARGDTDGHPGDLWGEVYRRSAKALNRIALAKKEGREIPNLEIFSVGWAHGFSGQVTPEWIEAVKDKGFEHYGEQYAELIKKIVPSVDERDSKVILTGYSAGTQVAYNAAKVLSAEKDEGTNNVEVELFAPAGFHKKNKLAQIQAALKIPAGFLGTVAALEVRGKMKLDPLFVEEREADEPFRVNLKEFLGDNFPVVTDEQEKLKLKTALLDVGKLIAGSDYSNEAAVKVRLIKGAQDPVSFNLQSVRSIGKTFRTFPAKDKSPHSFIIGSGGHYFDYNDKRVKRFLDLMHNVREASMVANE